MGKNDKIPTYIVSLNTEQLYCIWHRADIKNIFRFGQIRRSGLSTHLPLSTTWKLKSNFAASFKIEVHTKLSADAWTDSNCYWRHFLYSWVEHAIIRGPIIANRVPRRGPFYSWLIRETFVAKMPANRYGENAKFR